MNILWRLTLSNPGQATLTLLLEGVANQERSFPPGEARLQARLGRDMFIEKSPLKMR